MAGYIKWLDEASEMMKQIPSDKERLASFWVRRSVGTFLSVLLVCIGGISIPIFGGGKHGGRPLIDWGVKGRILSLSLFLLSFPVFFFLTRKQKGHVDIYPEMIVFYDYDPCTKKARPSQFYYWKDIVQYHREGSYLWIGSKDSEPVSAWIGICELRPYLEQYAPHAEVVRFNMKRYFEEREKKQSGQDEEK